MRNILLAGSFLAIVVVGVLFSINLDVVNNENRVWNNIEELLRADDDEKLRLDTTEKLVSLNNNIIELLKIKDSNFTQWWIDECQEDLATHNWDSLLQKLQEKRCKN